MNFRHQIFQLAMSFINIPLDQVDIRIQQALQQTAEFFDVDRAYIFDYDFSAGTVSNTYEWCAPGICEEIHNRQNIPMTAIKDWIAAHIYGEVVHVPEVSALISGPMHELLDHQQIKSLITLPLMDNNSTTGCVGFDAVKYQRHFGSEEIELLTIFAGLLVDLRTRTNLQKELCDKERRLSAVIDGTQAGTWEWNIQTGAALYNEQWAKMLGLQLSDLEPTSVKTWRKLVHPEDVDGAERLLQQHISGQTNFYFCEMRMRHKKGYWVWIQDTGRVYEWTEEGLPLLMAGTHQDISWRKRVEEALRKSVSFLRSTVDGLSAHIAVLDDQGEIILTNKSYRDFGERNGAEPSAVSEGTNYLAVCDTVSGEHSEEAKPFAMGLREVLSGKRQSFELEYPCHSPDEKRWFIGRVTPFTGEGPQRVIVAHENITERKQAEEKLKKQEQQRLDNLKVQRDTLVREVHHRIKNHLQGVLGLMHNSTADQPDLAAMMEPVIRRVKSVAEVYGINATKNANAITVSELIGRIICSYSEHDQIELSSEEGTQFLTLQIEEAVPTSLIINELLNNAVKHRLTRSPPRPVKIALSRVHELTCLTIASGPAYLPADFDMDVGISLGTGLELVQALMPSQDNHLELEQQGDEVVATYCFLADSQPHISASS